MSFVHNLWDRLKSAIEGEATSVEATLSELEQKLLPGFAALVKQIEKTIGSQGITILEQGLVDIAKVVAGGGSVSAAVSALVPQVTAQVKGDLKQDATNAAHGAAHLLVAALPTPAGTPPPATA